MNKAKRRTSHVARVYDAKLPVKAACGFVKKSGFVLLYGTVSYDQGYFKDWMAFIIYQKKAIR
jgi:hypothetical protein